VMKDLVFHIIEFQTLISFFYWPSQGANFFMIHKLSLMVNHLATFKGVTFFP
jgi:hypothetical protein